MDTAERVKKVVQEIEAQLLEKFGPMTVNNFDFETASDYSKKQSDIYKDEPCKMHNLENALRYKYWIAMSRRYLTIKMLIYISNYHNNNNNNNIT
jgi:hypothetical protein